MNSILQDKKECFECGKAYPLHSHHCMFGNPNRKLSEKYGLKVWLCLEHHEGDTGVHHNKELDLKIKRAAQRKAMEYYGWTVEDFIRIFGKNYL